MKKGEAIDAAWTAYYRAPNGTKQSESEYFERVLDTAGYVIVPKEPSAEMVGVIRTAIGHYHPDGGTLEDWVAVNAYRAMINAQPK